VAVGESTISGGDRCTAAWWSDSLLLESCPVTLEITVVAAFTGSDIQGEAGGVAAFMVTFRGEGGAAAGGA
jgi:hypothetical protein